MDAIDHMISNLKHDLALWIEEYQAYGPKGTAARRASKMKASDLAFLVKQITKLEALKLRVAAVLNEVTADVKERVSKW